MAIQVVAGVDVAISVVVPKDWSAAEITQAHVRLQGVG